MGEPRRRLWKSGRAGGDEVSVTLTTIKITSATEANAAHKRIVGTVQDAIEIGEYLKDQKESLPYGQWGKWVEDNLEFNRNTAASYVRLYDNREHLHNSCATSLTEAYRLLSEPSEPDKLEPDKQIELAEETLTSEPVESEPVPVETVAIEADEVQPPRHSWTAQMPEDKSTADNAIGTYSKSEQKHILENGIDITKLNSQQCKNLKRKFHNFIRCEAQHELTTTKLTVNYLLKLITTGEMFY
jgi:hypothetical protein